MEKENLKLKNLSIRKSYCRDSAYEGSIEIDCHGITEDDRTIKLKLTDEDMADIMILVADKLRTPVEAGIQAINLSVETFIAHMNEKKAEAEAKEKEDDNTEVDGSS